MRRLGWMGGVAFVVACASTSPAGPRGEVDELVASRVGAQDVITPKQDAESRTRVRERVERLLAEPLTIDRALAVAMLNNRGLHATLEELGVAQAELVEAGLLENPVIAGDLVISTKGNGLGGGVSLAQSLLSVFLIPAKRRLAKTRLRHAIVTVGHATIDLAAQVKVAFVRVQAATKSRQLQKGLVQAAEVADELAAQQIEAGNLRELDREMFAAALDEARLELADAALELTAAREDLSQLLGVWGTDTSWTVADTLPELPAKDPDLRQLERIAIRERLDVSAARFEVESMEQALALRRRGLVPQVEAGGVARNEVGDDPGHEWVLGPGLAIELPIFDPGHADFARLRALLRQAQHRLQHLAVVVRSDVRLHRAQLVTARRKVAYFRDTVAPRQQRIGKLTLEQYNAMQIGTYQLLETWAERIRLQRDGVDALSDYWVARARLELALGGRLSHT